MNRLKTTMLLAALTALFLWIGRAIGGQSGMITAFVFALVMNFGAYWFSDKIVLAMYGAKEIGQAEAPELHSVVNSLAQRIGIPLPKVYIIPMGQPNAFATGRNPTHAAVAVTEGILQLLSRDELEGVLGHELGHVVHRDTLISTISATLAGALSMLANMAMWGMMLGGGGSSRDDNRGGHPLVALAGIILAPLAATLIQLAISRSREFLADEAGAEYTGNPMALARALQKIDTIARRRPIVGGSPATAHLFIINPFRGEGLVRLFSTHPPTEERVRRLEDMAMGRN
ncbi:MAG: zinc metalloprotease HtpX [Elusimicrobia bacterium]|nr:zinc metalloprotease HtpX [Candidatus Obscuribacterium magneticum]